jgi:hypothetical protein
MIIIIIIIVTLYMVIVIVRILMSTFRFKDKNGLVKLIVGVVKYVTTINELRPVDYRGSNRFL